MTVLSLVLVGVFVFVIFATVRAISPRPVHDLPDRVARLRVQKRLYDGHHETPDWSCPHCDRRNPSGLRECEGCGAPTAGGA